MSTETRTPEMSTKPVTRPHHSWWWWLALLLLVVVPFLPEIAIYVVTGLAKLQGCDVVDKTECKIGTWQVSEIVAISLRAAVQIAEWMADYGIAVVWLTSCYLAITFGWRNRVDRLLLGLAVTIVFAVLPYLGPFLSISHLVNPNCEPNAGGVLRHLEGTLNIPGDTPIKCVMFGGDVGNVAHETVSLILNLLLTGVLVALVAFVAYAIVEVTARRFFV